MKISRTWLQTYFDTEIPSVAKLSDLFTFYSFEVEEVAGDILDVKILPDRAHYALSHTGIAEEVSAVCSIPRRLRSSYIPEQDAVVDAAVASVEVDVRAEDFCPRYMGRLVERVTVGNSPEWLQKSLESIGARSINSIVDATNFVMFNTGQPLHAFDADKVVGAITVRNAAAGEKIIILDGTEVSLTADDHVIADSQGPLAIAGVKGGKRAEVTASTTRIIIEAANFTASAVRKTSTRIGIRNDSSKRYENAITPAFAAIGMRDVSALIAKLSPEAQFGAVVDVYPSPVVPWTVAVTADFISAKLGTPITTDTIIAILTRLGITSRIDGATITATIPVHRLDIKIPEDLVEEVGRINGYDKIESRLLPSVTERPSVNAYFYYAEKIKNILISQSFNEVYLYSLVAKGHLEVAYPLASDKSHLRPNLEEGIRNALTMNVQNAPLLGVDVVAIFEIGKVFGESSERTSLGLGVAFTRRIKGMTPDQVVMNALTFAMTELGVATNTYPIPTPKNGVVEIDLDALIALLPQPSAYDLPYTPLPTLRYEPLSVYPFIVRDIALFVPSGTDDMTVARVITDAVTQVAGELVAKGPTLFDRFEKDGKLSLAYRIIFQSHEKTLSDAEANGYMDAVYVAVKAQNWTVR